MRFSPSQMTFYPGFIKYTTLPDDITDASQEEYFSKHPIPDGKLLIFIDGHFDYEDRPLLPDEVLWSQIRSQRNNLLKQCDWTQLTDSPLLNNVDWLQYRQALRDITNINIPPSSIVFPVKPID